MLSPPLTANTLQNFRYTVCSGTLSGRHISLSYHVIKRIRYTLLPFYMKYDTSLFAVAWCKHTCLACSEYICEFFIVPRQIHFNNLCWRAQRRWRMTFGLKYSRVFLFHIAKRLSCCFFKIFIWREATAEGQWRHLNYSVRIICSSVCLYGEEIKVRTH